MATTLLGIKPDSRKATNNLGIRTYSDTYLVESDNKNDTQFTVGSTLGLPLIGSQHPADSAAYCTTLDVQCVSGYKNWEVTATYTTERTISTTDPSLDNIMVSWTSEIYQEPVLVDKDGNAVVNSAGDFFVDPIPTRQAAHLIAKIRANLTSIPAWVLSYQDAVNDRAITVDGLAIATRVAKVQRIEISEEQLRNAVVFRELSFELHLRLSTWRLQPLDAGYRFKDATDDTMKQVYNDGDGSEPTTPAMLDGTGQVLTNPGPLTAVFGQYDVYNELDLSQLPGIT